MRVLVVDDDDIVRETVAELLVEAGFDVVPTGTVDAAGALIDSMQCDCVLLDLWMQGLRRRRRDSWNPHPAQTVWCGSVAESDLT